jgi:hypothetical protein
MRKEKQMKNIRWLCFLALLHSAPVQGVPMNSWQPESSLQEGKVMNIAARTDEKVVSTLFSPNRNEASMALEEVFRRKERMFPLLLGLEGNEELFHGSFFSKPTSSMARLAAPTGDPSFDQGRLITVEVTALYLICAIFQEELTFAQSPYLTDRKLPPIDRRARNMPALVKRAWLAVKEWISAEKKEGIDALRTQERGPLDSQQVGFW